MFLLARIFFVGSLPYLSITTFPQDVNKLKYNSVSLEFSYVVEPWWGDVDEPLNRPNASYSTTEENIVFGYNETTGEFYYFKKYGYSYDSKWSLKWLGKLFGGRNLFSVDLGYTKFIATSEGHVYGEDIETEDYSEVKYSYDLENEMTFFKVMAIHGRYLFGYPFGFKASFQVEDWGYPYSMLTGERDGVKFSSNRMLWGWSTSGCNHIFGLKHADADAWYQDYFSIGPVYRFDLQAGFTTERFRSGARYRKIWGLQKQYYWQPSDPNATDVLVSHFAGKYVENDWSRFLNEDIVRVYTNYNYGRNRFFKKNLLLIFIGDFKRNDGVYAENTALVNTVREAQNSYIVEVNPNYNFRIGPLLMDLGILIEGAHVSYGNTYLSWNPVVGGLQRVYWNTKPHFGDEVFWESFSYANENFIDLGIDTVMAFPLFGVPKFAGVSSSGILSKLSSLIPSMAGRFRNSSLFLMVNLMVNYKMTFQNKYYGENEVVDNEYRFVEHYVRKNFKREIWMNTFVSLVFTRKRWIFRFDFVEPLVYTIRQKTELHSLDDGRLIFSNDQNQLFAVQRAPVYTFSVGYMY